jgi:hypothetical protein
MAMMPAMTRTFVDCARPALCNAVDVISISCLLSPDAADQEAGHEANNAGS